MERRDWIGGSDIASVMGLSRWKSPLQLWAEKTGQLEPDDLSNNEAVQLGSELEDFVAKKFEKETGLKVRRTSSYYTHNAYDFIRCQVDRIIEKSDELLECKTAGAWKAKEWEGEEIPQEYILQVMWQLGITKRKVGWIAVLIGGQKFVYKKIEYDYDLFEKMVDSAIKFWSLVKNNVAPMAIALDNQIIADLYPKNNEQLQEATDLNDTIRYLQETKMHIANLKDEQDLLEARLKQKIGDNLGINTGDYVVTWKSQISRRVDSEALKADGLYDRYSKASETRVLRIKKDGAK